MSKLPAIQFYPGDWRKDPGIMPLDLAHRGLWFELLLLMHESPERGVLLTANREPMPMAMIGHMFRIEESIASAMIELLVCYGVATRRHDGALVSRRMVRDNDARGEMIEQRRLAGQKGAEKRWGPKTGQNDSDSKCHILPSVCHDKKMANDSSSSSSSSSSSTSSSTSTSTSKSKKKNAAVFDWSNAPQGLNTPKVQSAMEEWHAYRRECGWSAWKPVTIKTKLAEYENRPDELIAAIRHSIGNGWKGIFPNKNNTNGRAGGLTHAQICDSYNHPED